MIWTNFPFYTSEIVVTTIEFVIALSMFLSSKSIEHFLRILDFFVFWPYEN